MRCHHIWVEDVGKVLIPGCMGTAAMGIENCTCRNRTVKIFDKQEFNEAIRDKNAEIDELYSENAKLNRLIKKLLIKQNKINK